MKRKLTYLLLMILCFALAACAVDATAQTGADKVLVAGKKPLRQSEVNTLIEFYEWAFETRFDDSERARFQSFTERDYRAKPETVRGEINTIAETFAKIKVADEDVQRRTREVFVEGYIADLRKNETDEDAQFMIGIYENRGGATQNAEVAKNTPNDSAAVPAGRGASNLVGRWLKSGGAGGQRSPTGKTLYNSGNDVIFEFYADGRMMFVNDKNTLSITQCKITEMTKIPGTYSLSGNTLTMNLGAGTSVGTDSCSQKGNFKKTLNGDTLTKQVVVKRMESIFRPDAPLILCLDGQKDDECYEKVIK